MLTRYVSLAAGLGNRKWVNITRRFVSALLIGIYATGAGAQENQPTTYEGFEGRTVSQVDLAKSPVMNVEAFRPLIKQKPGEPFLMAAIRESVVALQKTALFSQV